MKGVVWITEGTSQVGCAVQHYHSLSESEKILCSIRETQKPMSLQDPVRRSLISRHRQMLLMMLKKKKSCSPIPHPSASASAPPDVLVDSVEPENSSQTVPTRRITFKRPPNPVHRDEHPGKRTRADDDHDSALLCVYQHDLGKVSEKLNDDNGVLSEKRMPDMLDSAWLAIKTKSQKREPT